MTVVCDLCGGPFYGNITANCCVGEDTFTILFAHDLCEGHLRLLQKLLKEVVKTADKTPIYQGKKP